VKKISNPDWSGNTNSIFKTLGASNHSEGERETNDYYATDPKAVTLLLDLENFSDLPIWECACGQGHLSKIMEKKSLIVKSSDIINRGYGEVYDFLSPDNKQWNGHIITNPPYKYAKEFVEKAISIVSEGCKIAMFLKIQFLEGKSRRFLFEQYPPKTVYISSSRLNCAKNGDFTQVLKQGSAVAYAWFIWQKNYTGNTTLKWFN